MGSVGLRGRCRIDVGTCLANPFPGRLHAPLSLNSGTPSRIARMASVRD